MSKFCEAYCRERSLLVAGYRSYVPEKLSYCLSSTFGCDDDAGVKDQPILEG
jgi:hypothetical protein